MKGSKRGWIVVSAGVGINLCLGVLYTWSMFTSALTNQWGWSSAQALTPYAIALAMFGLMMVFAGRLQDRIGPRAAATIGGVLVGAGMLVSSLARKPDAASVATFTRLKPLFDAATAKGALAADVAAFQPAKGAFEAAQSALSHQVGGALPWLAVGFGLLTGSGIGFAYAAATPAAVKWFAPKRKGLISGIVVAGFGLASLYTAPLAGNLLATAGVAATFRYLGIGFLAASLLFAQFLRNPPPGYVVPAGEAPPVDGETRRTTAQFEYTWQEMLRTPQFYLMWLMYAFAAGAGLMVVGIVAKYAQGVPAIKDQMTAVTEGFKGGGLDWVSKAGATFTVVMALAVGNGLGRPLTGLLSDRIGRARTMMIVFVGQAVLLLSVGLVQSFSLLLVTAAGIGFMYGANLTLFAAMTYDFFGTKHGGVNYGLVFTAWGAGGVLGSIGAGFAKDVFGSFDVAFYTAAALLMVAAGLTAAVRHPRPPRRGTAAETVPELAGSEVTA